MCRITYAMNKAFNKIKFLLKRPKVIIIVGKGRETAASAINQVLKQSFKIGKEILIYQSDLKNIREFEFFIKNSRSAILVVTHIGAYHPEREFFAGEQVEVSDVISLAKILPGYAHLVLNFDDETVRDIKNSSRAHSLTFGFGVRADMRASDIVLTQPLTPGTNFKINYQGNIVPVWLEKLFGKENIYAAMAAVAVGEILGMHLVEISKALGSYQGFSGRMKLIGGIKNTWILDDSESAFPLSMAEGLDILKRVETEGRRIAVLGDILGIGKYTIEAHEAIGERVKNSADMLFTVGHRAKFFSQGAKRKGMSEEKIFSFTQTKEVAEALQKEIKKGDLILIDGSKEMKMHEVVKEIKKV